jgi:hypothetical protein
MTSAFRPQPDLDPDDATLVESEGVNAGSADVLTDSGPLPGGADPQPVASPDGDPAVDAPHQAHSDQAHSDQAHQDQAHQPDAVENPGVVGATDADLYGPESGQDGGSME